MLGTLQALSIEAKQPLYTLSTQCQKQVAEFIFAVWLYVNSLIDYSTSADDLIKAKVVQLLESLCQLNSVA